MPAFASKIEFAMAGDFALVELDAKLDQILNPRRSFGHNRADHVLIAQARAGFECVADMQLEGIFVARHTSDSSLRPRRVGIRPFALGDDRHRTILRRFQRKAKPCNTAADDNEIVFLHPNTMLSIKRVFPKKTARARSEFGPGDSIACKLFASTRST